MEEILGSVTNDLSIWRRIGQMSAVDLFCGVWLDGSWEEFYVAPASLMKLGERGIWLTLDTYANIESNEEPHTP